MKKLCKIINAQFSFFFNQNVKVYFLPPALASKAPAPPVTRVRGTRRRPRTAPAGRPMNGTSTSLTTRNPSSPAKEAAPR